MHYRRNSDTELRELERQALATGDEEILKKFHHALARSTGHKPACSSVKYHLQYVKSEEAAKKAIADYIEKWPGHCEDCQGWGGKVSYYDPSPAGVGLSPGSMQDFDPCPTCLDAGICPRCGEKSADLVEEDYYDKFECSSCGWDDEKNNDGMPEGDPYPPECDCWEWEDVYGQRNPLNRKFRRNTTSKFSAYYDTYDLIYAEKIREYTEKTGKRPKRTLRLDASRDEAFDRVGSEALRNLKISTKKLTEESTVVLMGGAWQLPLMEAMYNELKPKKTYRVFPAIAEALLDTSIKIPSVDTLSLIKTTAGLEFRFKPNTVLIAWDKDYYLGALRVFFPHSTPTFKKFLQQAGAKSVADQINILAWLQPVESTDPLDHRARRNFITFSAFQEKTVEEIVTESHQWVSEVDPMAKFVEQGLEVRVASEVSAKAQLMLTQLAIGCLFLALSDDDMVKRSAVSARSRNLRSSEYADQYTIGREFEKLASQLTIFRAGHLRRGHMHWVRHGKGKKLRKLIFYHPVLVKGHALKHSSAADEQLQRLRRVKLKSVEPAKVPTDQEAGRLPRDTNMIAQLKAAYDNTCQMCGYKITKTDGSGYSIGAHILPFSEFKELDKKENILILCPTHHDEFDLGLLEVIPQARLPRFASGYAPPVYSNRAEFLIQHYDAQNPIHNKHLYVLPPGQSAFLPEGHNISPAYLTQRNKELRLQFSPHIGELSRIGFYGYEIPGPLPELRDPFIQSRKKAVKRYTPKKSHRRRSRRYRRRSNPEEYLPAKLSDVERVKQEIAAQPPSGSLVPSCPLVEEIPDNQPMVPRATFELMLSGNFPLIRVPKGESWRVKPDLIKRMSSLMTKQGIADANRWYDLLASCGTGATIYVMDSHGERYRVVDVNIDLGGETGELVLQHLGRRSRGGAVMRIDIWDAYGKMIPFVVYKGSLTRNPEEDDRCIWVQMRHRPLHYERCRHPVMTEGLCLKHHRLWRNLERERLRYEGEEDIWGDDDTETKTEE